eukprot:scaffold4224_cov216-Skeletonema_marinoi.AAC.5
MMRYTRNELRALHSIFSYHADKVDIHYDENDSASPLFIYPSQIFTVINELGRNEKELSRMNKALTEFQEQQQLQRRDPSSSTAACGCESSDSCTIASTSLQSNINEPNAVQIVAEVPVGCITFETFASIIDQGWQTQKIDDDECHMHFLGIVNQYQNRCDSEGKYLLAKDFMDQLSSLQKEEENRVVDKVQNMRMVDRAKIVEAHEKQLDEFAQNWDEYLTGLEQKSQEYMAEMQQIHEQQLDSLRKNLTHEIESKPKKWSKDLMDCRKSLENVAKQASAGRPSVSHTQLYREAQQIKQVSDALHEKEEADMNSKFNSVLSAKVRNLEKKQQAEMAALTKKIETKRREVTKKRKEDTLRLQQRNRNIVKMLDAKNVSPINLCSICSILMCTQLYTTSSTHLRRPVQEIGVLKSCLRYPIAYEACAQATIE